MAFAQKACLQEWGFNQSLEIARLISKRLKIRLDFRNINWIENTKPQSELSTSQRIKNVKNAFVLKKSFSAKHIAVLNDVMIDDNGKYD